MKLFYFKHATNNNTVQQATGDMLFTIMDRISELNQIDVSDFREYWNTFHHDCVKMIEFFSIHDFMNCGTIDSLEMDIFIVR